MLIYTGRRVTERSMIRFGFLKIVGDEAKSVITNKLSAVRYFSPRLNISKQVLLNPLLAYFV